MVFPTQALSKLMLLFLGAGLYTIAAPPYEQSWAGWLALTPLFLVIHSTTPGKAFAAGLLFGVLFCLGIAYWVYLAVSTYFPLPFPFDLLCTIASYSVFVGLYTGLAAMGSSLLMCRRPPLLCRIGVPALWVLGEFARSTLFSGFSWELLGYTQYRHLPLIQIADLTGVYGVSFLLALSSYTVAEVIHGYRLQAAGYGLRRREKAKDKKQKTKSKSEDASTQALVIESSVHSPQSFSVTPDSELRTSSWSAIAGLALLLGATFIYGVARLAEAPTTAATPSLTLALIKADVSHTQRWQRRHYVKTLQQYAEASLHSLARTPADLVVWPEFAIGFYIEREPALRYLLSQFTQTIHTSLLLGAPRAEETENRPLFYNSAYLLAPSGAVLDVYDKMRLLPFAEAWPAFLPSLLPQSMETPTAFTAGSRATIFSLSHANFGVLICYEATYPALARRLVQEGAQFLINTSNDTWLAGEAASAQHFSMAVFRAVETRRALARVATAGISGFVDPWGRLSSLSSASMETVLGEVSPQQQVSVYVRYGDWFVYACTGWVLMAIVPQNVRGWRHRSATQSNTKGFDTQPSLPPLAPAPLHSRSNTEAAPRHGELV